MQSPPLLQPPPLVALQHWLLQIPRLCPVLPAVLHQPSLPMPAQTAQPQAGEQPNLPKHPQHPANPNLTDAAPVTGESSPAQVPMPDAPLQPQQSDKTKLEETVRKLWFSSLLSCYSQRACQLNQGISLCSHTPGGLIWASISLASVRLQQQVRF